MIGHGQRRSGAIRILPLHRYVIAFADQAETEDFQRPDDLGLGSVNRELGHQTATLVSAMKASRTG